MNVNFNLDDVPEELMPSSSWPHRYNICKCNEWNLRHNGWLMMQNVREKW